eukprot:gene31947-17902_t
MADRLTNKMKMPYMSGLSRLGMQAPRPPYCSPPELPPATSEYLDRSWIREYVELPQTTSGQRNSKCGSALRVELVDEQGACVIEGLPTGVQLEVHVLNGEKYKEICPDNTLLSHSQLKSCVISHHTKALLKREGGSEDSLRCFLALERGQGPLSDLSVTTSSEALLAGKAPTFRLLVWAVDIRGEPAPNVTYVVSESFVVATKRVKHAIKSDIPSIADHVSKLVHIGKATVGKMNDLRSSAIAEGFVINVPDNLNCVDKVGQFQRLVHLSEMDSDLKNKVRHLLKLSPEKWDEVASHVLAAVVPDFRSKVWWCLHEHVRAGLLFECKNGSVSMDQPTALVKMGDGKKRGNSLPNTHLGPCPIQHDPQTQGPGGSELGAGLGMGVPPSSFPELPNAEPGHGPGAGLSNIFGTGDSMGNMGSLGNLLMDSTVNVSLPGGSMNPGSAYRQAPQTFPVQGPPSMGVPPTFPVPPKPPLPSPFAPLVTQQTTHTTQPQMPGASQGLQRPPHLVERGANLHSQQPVSWTPLLNHSPTGRVASKANRSSKTVDAQFLGSTVVMTGTISAGNAPK